MIGATIIFCVIIGGFLIAIRQNNAVSYWSVVVTTAVLAGGLTYVFSS